MWGQQICLQPSLDIEQSGAHSPSTVAPENYLPCAWLFFFILVVMFSIFTISCSFTTVAVLI